MALLAIAGIDDAGWNAVVIVSANFDLDSWRDFLEAVNYENNNSIIHDVTSVSLGVISCVERTRCHSAAGRRLSGVQHRRRDKGPF